MTQPSSPHHFITDPLAGGLIELALELDPRYGLEESLRVLDAGLARLKLHGAVVLRRNLEETRLVIEAVFPAATVEAKANALIGRPIRGVVLPDGLWPVVEATIEQQTAIYSSDIFTGGNEIFTTLFPQVNPSALAEAFGLTAQQSSVQMPLVAGRQAFGVLVIWGELSEAYLPLAMLVTHKLSLALNSSYLLDSLQASEQRHRILSEIGNDFAVVLDVDSRNIATTLWVSERLRAYLPPDMQPMLFDYPLLDVAHRWLHPADLPTAQAWWLGLLDTGLALPITIRVTLGQTQMATMHLKARLLQPTEGGARQVFIVARDVTQEQAAEHQLTRYTQELATLVRVGQAVVARLDLNDVLKLVMDSIQPLINAERSSVLLLDEDQFVFAATSGVEMTSAAPPRMPANTGIAGEVLATGKSVWVKDDHDRQRMYRAALSMNDYQVQTMLAVPLRLGQRVIGVVEAVHSQPNAFTENDLYLLEAAANWAAIAISNAQEFEAAQRRLEETEALFAISRELLNPMLDVNEVFSRIVQAAVRLIPNAQRAVIHLLNERRDELTSVAVAGQIEREGPPRHGSPMRPGEGVAGMVAANGGVMNVGDVTTDPRFVQFGRTPDLHSMMVAAVEQPGERYGTISVLSATRNAFDEDSERLLQALGVQAALAISNARMVNSIQHALQQEKATRARLVQTEKLASMGRLVASVAHELNNPLQALQNALFLVRDDPALDEQSHADLDVALAETNRMAGLINRLRDTYRPTMSDEFAPADLNALVTEVQRLIGTHMRHNDIIFNFAAQEDLPLVTCIRDQIKQVLLNLCLNAVDAMPRGGVLQVTSAVTDEGDHVRLVISDTGQGIKPEYLDSIFDPFFTTKEGGTGLGLAISYDIVRRHQGYIEASSELGQGTTITMTLPIEVLPDTLADNREDFYLL